MSDQEEEFEQLQSKAGSGDPDAMNKLGDIAYEQGDSPHATEWYRRASDLGHLAAMENLAFVLESNGDIESSEEWYRKSAELGSAYSMSGLGEILRNRGDIGGAEEWFRRSSELDHLRAMENLASLLEDHGDIEGAEEWFLTAADLGSTYAMTCLGLLMKNQANLEAAEEWLRRAALDGRASAMNHLGILLRERGEVDQAEEWFRRSSAAGQLSATNNVAHLLETRHDYLGAEEWYRNAADQGSGYAWDSLGRLLVRRGDLDGAERCLRKAIEAGFTESLLGLGVLDQTRGRLVESELWFRQAIDENVPGAGDSLELFAKVLGSLELMSAISFDTFTWTPVANQENIRVWRSDKATLVEKYIPTGLDLTDLDDEEIRAEMKSLVKQIDSPSFDASELDIPEEFGVLNSETFPKQVSILDLNRFELDGARCLTTVTRHRMHDEVHYSSATLICFRDCLWILGIELEEVELVGAREAAVARLELKNNDEKLSDIAPLDPYDPEWDGLIPVEDDPLTRLRQLTSTLCSSVVLGEATVKLKRLGDDSD